MAPYPQGSGELCFRIVHAVDRDAVQTLEEEGNMMGWSLGGPHGCTQITVTSDSIEPAAFELYPEEAKR